MILGLHYTKDYLCYETSVTVILDIVCTQHT